VIHLDLIELVFDSLPKWIVSCLVLAILLIPGAEPAVVNWVQREATSEFRSEMKSVLRLSTRDRRRSREQGTFRAKSR
jgi:hypothetical protein